MLAQVSTWLLAAVLGQAPAEASPGWLKVVPSEADVVVRSRGIVSSADDVKAMLQAMSPTAAGAAVPAITQFVDQWKAQYGADVVDAPVVGMLRVEAPGPDGVPPFAMLVMKDDLKGVLKALAGGKDVATEPQDGGYVSFTSPFGPGSWYAYDGEGFTAFGPDKVLIGGVAKPGDKSLAATLAPALSAPFLGGDLGVYVDAARLVSRYGDQIDQARQSFMAAIDQGAQNAPNGASMDFAKDLYGGLFDSLQKARTLTLNFDFAAEGLRVAGRLEAKSDAAAKPAEAVANVPTGIDKLDPEAAFFMYMNMPAASVQKWQSMSLRMLNPGNKPDPTLDRAMEQFKSLGQIQTFGTAAMADGMRTFNVTDSSDPKAYIAAAEAMLLAMKSSDSPYNFYKDVKIERDAENFGGVSYTRMSATFDAKKLAELGQGANEAQLKKMLGDSLNYWIGVDGNRVIQVTAPTWDEARGRLERFAKGDSAVGALAGFKKVRSELADRASFLMIVSGQGLVNMMAKQLAATSGRPDLKAPAGIPAEPAFLGASLTPDGPTGYEFRFSLPSTIGPVVEKGLIPLFRSVQARPGAAPVAPPARRP